MTIQIAHVGLRNIRSYRTAELDLSPGTTLLSGDIGSGKTSLLYAIELALFGFAEVDPGYLVRHRARDAEVTLTLTDGTHRWELRRRFTRRTRKAREAFEPTDNSLAVDGQRTAYSATELRRRTIELLGFPDNPNPRAHSDVWRWAVYLAQERMRDVLDPDVEARMETVRKALGVEQYRLAGENAHSLSRSLQERAADLAEQGGRHRGVEEESAHWREEAARARQDLARMEARERELREELDRGRATLERLELRRREFQAAREAVAHEEQLAKELNRSLEQDRTAQQNARDRLARIEADYTLESAAAGPAEASLRTVEPLRARREELVRQLTGLEEVRGQASGVEEQLAQWNDRYREAEVRHEGTVEQWTTVRRDQQEVGSTDPVVEPLAPGDRTYPELEGDRNSLEEARRTIDRRLTTATVELQELAELVQDGVCPRCHRPVEASEFESHRQEQEALVLSLQRELETATKEVGAAEGRALARLEYERLHDRWEQLEARRADLRQREATLQANATEEEDRMAQLRAERATLETRRQGLSDRLEEVVRVREEIAFVETELAQAEEQARQAAARKERLAALEQQIPEIQSEIEARRQAEADRAGRLEGVRKQIEVDRGRLKEAPELEERWNISRLHLDELGRSFEGVLREASGPQGKLAEATARLDELERRLQERQSLEQQSIQLSRLADWMDQDFRSAMLELERRRLQHGRLQFERRFAQYFAALVEDPALSARVDDSFAPWVDIAGQATPAEALSGGERTALALAYRLALGRTVRDAGRLALETLILDEPTEGFSQEQTLRMGDLVEGLGLPQVILVSHERQLEGIADRVVRVRKKDGVSMIEEGDRGSEYGLPPTSTSEEPLPKLRAAPRRRKARRLTDLGGADAVDGSTQAK